MHHIIFQNIENVSKKIQIFQKVLDAEFEIADDWKFVAKKIENEVVSYIKRNKINDNSKYSDHLKYAEHLKNNIIQTEDDLKDE